MWFIISLHQETLRVPQVLQLLLLPRLLRQQHLGILLREVEGKSVLWWHQELLREVEGKSVLWWDQEVNIHSSLKKKYCSNVIMLQIIHIHYINVTIIIYLFAVEDPVRECRNRYKEYNYIYRFEVLTS